MKTRRAEPADAALLAPALSDWIDATEWMPRLHSREDDLCFVARLIDEGIVTMIANDAPAFIACRDAHIVALYVSEEVQSMGLGRVLVEKVQSENDRLTLWVFEQNLGARRFYERAGFAELRRTQGDNEEKLPDILMEWRR